jgi:glycogen synthase
MEKKNIIPDYVFEVSWEVCNKIGGIYTVLSTGAKALQTQNKDKNIYIGPYFGNDDNPLFKENKTLFKSWKKQAIEKEGFNIKIGRWEIPGKPIVILVDFKPFMSHKNDFFYEMWENFGVDSLAAYGDYDESAIFGYAAGKVIESFWSFNKLEDKNIIAHFHEWTTASGLLYLKKHVPAIATIFTTHATTVGRSICFNNKPLYKCFENYNGDQMAAELNVTAKHSIEKNGARHADCFTTVSEQTAKECAQLLEKNPDIVTPNGFEGDFVPKGTKYKEQHLESRAILKKVAEALLGYSLKKDAVFIGTSGRYEYKNKGIDVFVEALKRLDLNAELEKDIVAFIMVPGCISGPRKDLQEKLENPKSKTKLLHSNVTHQLFDYCNDEVISALQYFGLENKKNNKVKVIFVPSYLDGQDGIFNKSYYDLLIGLDMTVFPSYYEPWGYTPMESAAFSIPTITTDLSGFGLWVSHTQENIENGVAVLHRTEDNYHEIANDIQNNIILFSKKNKKETEEIKKQALAIAQKGSWNEFCSFYFDAFNIALNKLNK